MGYCICHVQMWVWALEHYIMSLRQQKAPYTHRSISWCGYAATDAFPT